MDCFRRHSLRLIFSNYCRLFHCESIESLERSIPKTLDDFGKFPRHPIEQPENARMLKVTIAGCPNAGKSTLLNQLVKWKISAVSSKVHTTRRNIVGVYCENETQIKFFDTPGLISKAHLVRHNLEISFMNDLKFSTQNSDIIAVLIDASNHRERSKLNPGILELLRYYPDKESILILNKIDAIKEKRSLIEIVSNLTGGFVDGQKISDNHENESQTKFEIKKGKFEKLFKKTEKYLNYRDRDMTLEDELMRNVWPKFSKCFMISSLYNDGIDDLRKFFVEKAQLNSWIYDARTVTSQNPKSLIIDAIREVCLETFKQEIPYDLRFQIVMWDIDEIGNIYLVIDVFIKKKFLPLLIGPKGSNISKIVNESRKNLSSIFRCDVSLKIAAKSF
ncbi:GTPase Era [Sarcoptes scabiei]|uniref:GTPase Era, mitochondrial n=1 Tax=Sarcoptes scabiei TaxID=52283 RepID=A0A834R0U5_SARSC|nr:GTPase Era [Sarcoptes scabiei]UXI17163.1 hypothetical protein NH340_JMT03107 [Sarcoptes scabiei]